MQGESLQTDEARASPADASQPVGIPGTLSWQRAVPGGTARGQGSRSPSPTDVPPPAHPRALGQDRNLHFRFFSFFYFGCTTRYAGILVPRPGIEPSPPAVEARSLNHWTAREVQETSIFKQRRAVVGPLSRGGGRVVKCPMVELLEHPSPVPSGRNSRIRQSCPLGTLGHV